MRIFGLKAKKKQEDGGNCLMSRFKIYALHQGKQIMED
jgi:hypothetical protein